MKRSVCPLSPLLLVLILWAISVSSCQRDAALRPALTRAEALLESNPSAARALLDSIASPKSSPKGEDFKSPLLQEGRGEAALYAWLRTQADYKCNIPLTSDSLARVATDYYGVPRHKNYHAAMAWYTLGCVYTDLQDDPKAISAYLKACDCFPDTTSRYYPLTLQNLGRHYLRRRMYEKAADTFIRFRDASEAIDAPVSLAFAHYYLGFTRLQQLDYAAADSLFDVLLQSDTVPPYCRKGTLLHKAKIAFYSRDDHPQALSYLRACRNDVEDDRLFAAGFCLMGDIFVAENQLDSAYHYYRKALECKDELYSMATTYHHLGDVIMRLHGADEAKACIDNYDLLLDSIYHRQHKYDISAVSFAFDTENREAAYRYDLRLHYVYGIASAAVLALAAILLVVVRRNRRKAQSLKVHETLRRSELALARTSWVQWAELNDEEKALRLSEYANTLSGCLSIFRQTPSEHILQLLQKKETQLTSTITKVVADDIGKSFIDAIQFLRMETYPDAPKFSEADWLLCILSYLHLPLSCIADLLYIEKDSVRKKRHRLEAKIPPEILSLFFSSHDAGED